MRGIVSIISFFVFAFLGFNARQRSLSEQKLDKATMSQSETFDDIAARLIEPPHRNDTPRRSSNQTYRPKQVSSSGIQGNPFLQD